MARQTQRALADRAVRAAELMEFWVDRILNDLHEQNENLDWFSDTTVKLRFQTIRAMMDNMRTLSADIRKFEGNLTREIVRGHGRP
jgi:hypothetical protein